jgi:2,5-diketo-D-gluconate reductase B
LAGFEIMESLKLKSGNEMPVLGLGTWQLTGSKCKEAVKKALELGYRHIDTADVYGNHKEVGEGIKESGVKREELFLTTKVWKDDVKGEAVISNVERFLKELGVEYVDLLLIHWPSSNVDVGETFKAFEELKKEGKIRAYGVSNFNIERVKESVEKGEVSVNQVEYHAYLNQEDLLKVCKEKGVVLTAYSPIARGELLEEEILKKIAEEKGKSVCQIALRWLVQKEIIVIPKASSEEHIKENMEIFDFELNEGEMEEMNNIKESRRLVNPGFSDFED